MNELRIKQALRASRPAELSEPGHRAQLERHLRDQMLNYAPAFAPWTARSYIYAGCAAALLFGTFSLIPPPAAKSNPAFEFLVGKSPLKKPVHHGSVLALLPKVHRNVSAPPRLDAEIMELPPARF